MKEVAPAPSISSLTLEIQQLRADLAAASRAELALAEEKTRLLAEVERLRQRPPTPAKIRLTPDELETRSCKLEEAQAIRANLEKGNPLLWEGLELALSPALRVALAAEADRLEFEALEVG
jgi:hypothetical protein